MRTNTNNSGNALIILLVVVAVAAAWLLYESGKPMRVATAPVNQEVIADKAQLQSVAKSLDSTDIDGTFNPDMNQLQTDVSQIK